MDAMVFNDTFSGFPSPSYPCKIARNADGGLDWTTYGPDNDDEFMNVLNRHQYFVSLLSAWNATGNPVYPKYFDSLVQDWVLHLPCNNASGSSHASDSEKCVPLGTQKPPNRICSWEHSNGGACATGTFESPWRSLEMGIRIHEWAPAFFGFQQSDDFTVDGRVLMLLALGEHLEALVVDGGHPGKGTVNWEMTQWQGLLTLCGTWPEISGAADAARTAFG